MTTIPPPSPGPLSGPSPTGASDPGSGPRRGRRWTALVIALVGLVAGVALWVAASARHDDGVRSLARAPVGCDTTLDFADTGDYLVFVETRGEFPDVRGDCELRGTFDLSDSDVPTAEVRVVDPGGDEVALLSRRGRESYDRAGSRGESLARITIEEAGDHVVRVESTSDTAFAVAIGRDPADGVALLRLVGVALMLVGIVVAVIVALSGRSKRPDPVAVVPVPPEFGSGGWGAPPASGPPPMQSPQGPPPAPTASWMPPPPGTPAPTSPPPAPGATTPSPAAPAAGEAAWPTVPWPTASDPSPWDDPAAGGTTPSPPADDGSTPTDDDAGGAGGRPGLTPPG